MIPDTANPARPILRGWIHLGMFPVVTVLGVILVLISPDAGTRVTAAIFGVSSALLFGCSALYHRRVWSPKVTGILRRLDHSNIFLIIAGTYTPLAWALLPAHQARVLLWIVWTGAVLGIVARVCWVGAPRWLYVPLYVALGWVAVAYLPTFWNSGGPTVVIAIIVGGVAYTLGALVYGTKWPNPSPKWFGFHELFHSLTVVGFLGTYVAALTAVTNGS